MKNIYLPSLETYTPQEVSIIYKRPLFNSMIHIHSLSDSVKYLRMFIDQDRIDYKEFFWVLLLNNTNRLIAFSEVGMGTDSGVVINHKEIFQLILRTNAKRFIVAHNHPSGQLKASKKDVEETHKIREVANFIAVELLDHIIITSESYASILEDS